MRHVRIVSDGSPLSARIYDENDEMLTTVTAVVLRMSRDEVTADLTVVLPRVDVVAKVGAVDHVCPYCGHSEVEEAEA